MSGSHSAAFAYLQPGHLLPGIGFRGHFSAASIIGLCHTGVGVFLALGYEMRPFRAC